MKDLMIRKIQYPGETGPEIAGHLLEKYAVSHRIDTLNWSTFNYKPKVSFRIGYHDDEIWLKYYVREKYIRARETRINGEVYKDSCVEFFVSLGNAGYYNFEFSCIGTVHLGYGPGRKNRQMIHPDVIKNIKILSSLGKIPFEERQGDFEWEMTVLIPKSCFINDQFISFSGLKAHGNFYKCGDGTSEPHYLTWNPIQSPAPDYHRPEFFGLLNFE